MVPFQLSEVDGVQVYRCNGKVGARGWVSSNSNRRHHGIANGAVSNVGFS